MLALEETFISIRRISRAMIFRFNSKNQRQMITLRPPCLCPSEGHKHSVSIQSSINLGDTLLDEDVYDPLYSILTGEKSLYDWPKKGDTGLRQRVYRKLKSDIYP